MLLAELFLFENRLDFLRTKYAPILNDYMLDNESNPNVKKLARLTMQNLRGTDDYFKDLGKKALDWLLSLDTDPTKKYSQWIINLFLRNELNPEDGYKLRDDLVLFDRVKGQLPVDKRDINRYKSPTDLFGIIYPFSQSMSKRQSDKAHDEAMYSEARVVFEDSRYRIVVPLTMQASCHFGVNTRWCTAASNEDDNAFDDYYKKGDLYVILDKKNNRRWQFHFEDGQFMDEEDMEIDQDAFLASHPAIARFFIKMEKENFLGYVNKFPAFKTARGFVVKDTKRAENDMFRDSIGSFVTNPDGELVHWQWNSGEGSYNYLTDTSGLAKIFNMLKIKSDFEHDVYGIYYRNGTWGTIEEIGTPVAKAGKHTWKVISEKDNDHSVGANHYKLTDGTKKSDFSATAVGGQFFVYYGNDDQEFEISDGQFTRLTMPLIKAQPEIKYWNLIFSPNFDNLPPKDKEWILKNRPTLCSPSYAYEHFGDSDLVKDIINHVISTTHLATMIPDSNQYYPSEEDRQNRWVDDKMIGFIWPNANAMLQSIGMPTGTHGNSIGSVRYRVHKMQYVYAENTTDPKQRKYVKGFMDDPNIRYVMLIPIKDVVQYLTKFSEIERETWPQVVYKRR